ncbi:MAG: hypothetical protein H0T46_26655 [Deltaproteobacteria bacterium]|nr:hypothetical protein [Deltaproteobacteria bacterium]
MRMPWIAVLAVSVPHAAFADEDEAPPLSIYGSARLDILADDSRMSNIHAPLFVEQEPSGGRTNGELTMTPRLSQIGLGIDEWQLDERGRYMGEGKLEVDFAGGAGTNVIRLRHAYATVTVRRKFEILAGQTWDLISPLHPSVQNDTQLLFAGNTGDRRPQVRLSALPMDNVRIAVAAAATGTLDQRDLDGDGQVDGMAAGTPMLQGMIELRQPLPRSGRPILLGLWGHVAREELADGTRHPSRSIGVHLQVPAPFVMWSAELYGGTNASDIGGAVGQGINPMTGRRVHSVGGWLELAFAPTKRHVFAVGGSGDFAQQDDIMPGERSGNGTVFSALRYKPKSTLLVGVEYLYWKTLYRGTSPGIANRVNLMASVLF